VGARRGDADDGAAAALGRRSRLHRPIQAVRAVIVVCKSARKYTNPIPREAPAPAPQLAAWAVVGSFGIWAESIRTTRNAAI